MVHTCDFKALRSQVDCVSSFAHAQIQCFAFFEQVHKIHQKRGGVFAVNVLIFGGVDLFPELYGVVIFEHRHACSTRYPLIQDDAMYIQGPLDRPLRRKTRPVSVGDVIIGGDQPIVVQSMTTTPTTDTDATVAQIESLVKAGCPLVRLTVPRQADLDNLKNIKKRLREKHLTVPLVADIHFLPKLALGACDYVDKVRINPGNFADRKRFEVREYTDEEYAKELSRVAEAFVPIVRKAKERGIAMRIGTNHGSLSDRIMNRFGDTPQGMVESALEFIHIAREENYHDLICSMKSSNPFVMIQAYRLLVKEMNARAWDYPLHLGVTEAGDGQDGRVKSAIGIGSLLFDGLGDTIRVSLTEDPEKEIPVALQIASLFSKGWEGDAPSNLPEPSWNPFEYMRRTSDPIEHGSFAYGGQELIKVRTHGSFQQTEPPIEAVSVPSSASRLPQVQDVPHFSLLDAKKTQGSLQGAVSVPVNPAWLQEAYLPKLQQTFSDQILHFRIERQEQLDTLISLIQAFETTSRVGVDVSGRQIIGLGRLVAIELAKANLNPPMHLRVLPFDDEKHEQMMIRASVELGALLSDGIGDSIEVVHDNESFAHLLSFGILQATRLRMSRTDYISCPSCGRTLFDLQETTARIREKTNHLKGVKIAIMGCIVNGPGEMADADFGYVGSGPGKINLFVGKECVEKNIDQQFADDRLIDLIKSHGRWIEPS